ncbi:MAG: E3 binding domain-containing protein, partial [Planctomycetota bacterium]
MVLGDKDEDVPQSFVDSLAGAEAPAPEAAPAAEAAAAVEPPVPEPEKPVSRVMASPRAKRLAGELGVDLSALTGTGPAGKITEQDVKDNAEAKPAAPAAPAAPGAEPKLGETVPL